MTADIELLPLPSGWSLRRGRKLYSAMEDYARANVAHATAAKGAEIDVLRTRLEDAVRDSTNEIEALRAEREVIGAEAVKYAGKSGRLEAKVERLAEALRGGVAMLERLHGDMGPCEESNAVWGVRDTLKTALARAALQGRRSDD